MYHVNSSSNFCHWSTDAVSDVASSCHSGQNETSCRKSTFVTTGIFCVITEGFFLCSVPMVEESTPIKDNKPATLADNTSPPNITELTNPNEAVYDKERPRVTWPNQLNAPLEVVDP
ncbi:hypothetical protein Ahy_B08g089661 isoform A [Arachis hypogaea]|uniref:Uncharacterized protein n=1 Tax=Arachis hypogaea TaxID=3818 RepID=A0A444XYH9_ARAHY|nr:hypothetical protein Ahy_B08g089661 isoform A [Arachis hypogaea]